MCTVLLRLRPGGEWPVLLAAVRDEFTERPWDPPAAHWSGAAGHLLGGRDRTAGGTWLAVDPRPERPAAAALLNGVRRPPLEGGTRPTRGTLALDALATGFTPTLDAIADHDSFHLLVATPDSTQVWSWDGDDLRHQRLEPGDHIAVNLGVDTDEDPLVPHFAPLLEALPDPLLDSDHGTDAAWTPWTGLLEGDGLDPEDPRALLVRREIEGRTYGSTSASLVGLGRDQARYDFTGNPWEPKAWRPIVGG